MEMTRRSFVGAAGAVAATAAVAAGVTPSSALAEDKAFAKDEFEGETANIPPVEPPASYDYEADIVVVGAGGGLSGALRALDLGASAIVIEKLPMIGGETQEACVFAFTSGNQCQLDAGLPDVTDTLLQKGKETAVTLQLPGMTREERDIVLAGCLINYYNTEN